MKYITIARAAYGLLLLLASGAVVQFVSGKPAQPTSVLVGRILGLRHLAQALLIDRAGTHDRLLVGAAVDAAHALSMAGLATLDRDHRWPATLDAALATGLAVNAMREV